MKLNFVAEFEHHANLTVRPERFPGYDFEPYVYHECAAYVTLEFNCDGVVVVFETGSRNPKTPAWLGNKWHFIEYLRRGEAFNRENGNPDLMRVIDTMMAMLPDVEKMGLRSESVEDGEDWELGIEERLITV